MENESSRSSSGHSRSFRQGLQRPRAQTALCYPAIFCLAALTVLASACIRPVSRGNEISRERAIEIARAQVSFHSDSVKAVRTMSGAQAVWRVTFRGRLPGQPPLLFETVLVEVDRRSGEIVSIARS